MLGSDEKHKSPYLLKFRSLNLKAENELIFLCFCQLLGNTFLANLLLLLTNELSFLC
jgi:hypothetical protein